MSHDCSLCLDKISKCSRCEKSFKKDDVIIHAQKIKFMNPTHLCGLTCLKKYQKPLESATWATAHDYREHRRQQDALKKRIGSRLYKKLMEKLWETRKPRINLLSKEHKR